MCERYFLKDSWQKYAKPLTSGRNDNSFPALKSNYNIAPRQDIPFIAMEKGEVEIGFGKWGYIASWADELPRYRMFSVQSESIHRQLITSNNETGSRCLIPASGYYEWVEVAEDEFRPYCVTLPLSEPFFMAGICAKNNKLGVISCAVLTASSPDNSQIGRLSHRAPLIPEREIYFDWLNPALEEPAIRDLMASSRISELVAYPVGEAINNAAANGPELINPVANLISTQ